MYIVSMIYNNLFRIFCRIGGVKPGDLTTSVDSDLPVCIMIERQLLTHS